MNIVDYWEQVRELLPDTNDFLTGLSLFLLSFVVPIGIFVGRNNIRASRRQIVRELEKLFSFAKLPNGKKLILPSFELVKYKYDPKSDPDRDTKERLMPLLPVRSTCCKSGAGGLRRCRARNGMRHAGYGGG